MSWSEYRVLAVCAALSLLCACGFRLQGVDEFPESLAKTYIDTPDRYTLFYRKLQAELEHGGVEIVDSPVRATSVIRIERDESGQRVLTVDGRNVPTEYDVFYNVEYSVWSNGEQALETQRLEQEQSYTYDETTVLGKNREREAIRSELAVYLVRQTARQLSLL